MQLLVVTGMPPPTPPPLAPSLLPSSYIISPSLPLPLRYDRQNTFRRMDDCLFVTAMGPPGGGRNQVRSLAPPA